MRSFALIIALITTHAFADLKSPFKSSVDGLDLPNAHQVDSQGLIFRGMAPAGHEQDLLNLGVHQILIFKHQTNTEVDLEIKSFRKLGVPSRAIHHIPFRWKQMQSAEVGCTQLIEGLRLIKAAQEQGQMLFFHCTVGEDRTGALAGLWRMLEQGLTSNQAFAQEMCARGYSEGNKHKPANVTGAIQKELTPLFLAVSSMIESGKISMDNLDESSCQDLRLRTTRLNCQR